MTRNEIIEAALQTIEEGERRRAAKVLVERTLDVMLPRLVGTHLTERQLVTMTIAMMIGALSQAIDEIVTARAEAEALVTVRVTPQVVPLETMPDEDIKAMREANTRMARALDKIGQHVPTVEHYAEMQGLEGWKRNLPSAVHISLSHITDAVKAGQGDEKFRHVLY